LKGIHYRVSFLRRSSIVSSTGSEHLAVLNLSSEFAFFNTKRVKEAISRQLSAFGFS
jgi:hypothetical protein